MTGVNCGCGIPQCRPNDNYCIRCNKIILEGRIKFAKVIPFPADYTTKPCSCTYVAKSNWGVRTVDNINICGFCGKYSEGLVPSNSDEDLEFFSELDLPYTLDPTKHQYKVITQKDRFFSSKFNPALIERALNEYAQEGWVFKTAVTADFGSMGMSRNELILFMERKPNGEVNS